MRQDDKNDWTESFAANYVQLCGTLAGFCGGFIIFLLSPGLFPSRSPELTITLLLLAAFGYTYAAALSAYSIKFHPQNRADTLRFVDNLFLLSNTVLWLAFIVVLFALNYYWASGIASLLLIASLITSTIPSLRGQIFRMRRSRK